MKNNVNELFTKDMNDAELTQEEISQVKEETSNFLDELRAAEEETKGYPFASNVDEESNQPWCDANCSSALEEKVVNESVNPVTGERQYTATAQTNLDHKTFEEIIEDINNFKDTDILGGSFVTESDLLQYLENANDNILGELYGNIGLTADDMRELIKIINRRMKGEDFNVYKAMPEKLQQSIKSYAKDNGIIGIKPNHLNSIYNAIACDFVDQFISEIKFDRAKNDFARELEHLYNEASREISDANLEYVEDRNNIYREAAEKIEDEEKREKLKEILDTIDSAREINELKEFALKCRIKPIELEKVDARVYSPFLSKYKDSVNNIYDIHLAESILTRHMQARGFGLNHCRAFLICFCKYVKNYSVDNPIQHAYMYYVLYYCAMLDSDKSEKFKNNVAEVINNLLTHNNIG